ncbi:hypothetical protein HanPSC8_Chr04g0179981 [Helianthus annuus]|nr:hypothetical protein HanPSC8_Chr04g0179981 [Helianthus annuus]
MISHRRLKLRRFSRWRKELDRRRRFRRSKTSGSTAVSKIRSPENNRTYYSGVRVTETERQTEPATYSSGVTETERQTEP